MHQVSGLAGSLGTLKFSLVCIFTRFRLHLRSNVSAETTPLKIQKTCDKGCFSKFFSDLVALKRAVGFPGSSTKQLKLIWSWCTW